jgi:uncharacterized membrane protein YfcA
MPRGRKLNIPLIKGIVMCFLGFWVAVGSALSGIGAQVAAAPMIHFLLGFIPERTAGTAMAFTFFAMSACALTATLGGVHTDLRIALLLAVSATIGAALVARYAADPRLSLARRTAQSLAVVLGVFVIGGAMRPSWSALPMVPTDFFRANPVPGFVLLGFVSGILSNLLSLSSGVLLVPAMLFFVGMKPPEAILLSVTVIALASLIPALSYSARGLVDRSIGPWMAFGGVAGGLLGGYVLSRLALAASPVPLVAFGLIAMFLSAWMLWKMT